MEFKTFSCYDNFVPCNNCGSPDHTPTHYALQHLERLLQGISQRLRSMPASELLPPATNDPAPPTDEAVSDDGDGLVRSHPYYYQHSAICEFLDSTCLYLVAGVAQSV
jgi:hypothetical protein